MHRIIIQVDLCQKLLFLHQLTHNMTTDCSLNYKFNTWKFLAQNMGRTCCVQKLFLTFRTISVHNMFSPYSPKRRASDKDLPVSYKSQEKPYNLNNFKPMYVWSIKYSLMRLNGSPLADLIWRKGRFYDIICIQILNETNFIGFLPIKMYLCQVPSIASFLGLLNIRNACTRSLLL